MKKQELLNIMDGELLEKLLQYRANGFALEGMADYRGEEIQIVKA